MIFFGERALRKATREYVAHYHRERNHQGIGCFFDDALHQVVGLAGCRYQDLYHFTVGGAVEDPRLRTRPAYAHREGPSSRG